MQTSAWDVDLYAVAISDQCQPSTLAGLRRDVPDRQAGRRTGESPVRDQRAFVGEAAPVQCTGRKQHLLHARTALRPFVAYDDDLPRLDPAVQNCRDGVGLAFENGRFAAEFPHALGYCSRLDDTAVLGQVTAQHGQPAVARKRMLHVAQAAGLAIDVQLGVTTRLRESLGRAYAARRRPVELCYGRIPGAQHVPLVDGFAEARSVHGVRVAMNQACPVEFAENPHDAAGAVDVLDVHVQRRRRHFAEVGRTARDSVDVFDRETGLCLLGSGQQMQDRIGRTAHRHIEPNRVLESFETGDRARQHRVIALFVVAFRNLDDQPTRPEEELLAIGVRCHDRPVTGQRQTDHLGQAVHRVRRKHARTRAAGRAG